MLDVSSLTLIRSEFSPKLGLEMLIKLTLYPKTKVIGALAWTTVQGLHQMLFAYACV